MFNNERNSEAKSVMEDETYFFRNVSMAWADSSVSTGSNAICERDEVDGDSKFFDILIAVDLMKCEGDDKSKCFIFLSIHTGDARLRVCVYDWWRYGTWTKADLSPRESQMKIDDIFINYNWLENPMLLLSSLWLCLVTSWREGSIRETSLIINASRPIIFSTKKTFNSTSRTELYFYTELWEKPLVYETRGDGKHLMLFYFVCF